MSPMRVALFLLTLALSSLASAQSLDCKVAKTPREKAVCASPKLSALDSQIAANYKALRAQLSPAAADAVQSDQREWLGWIDRVCPPNGKGAAANQARCLQNQYSSRARDLTAITHLGNTVIFPRAHFLFKPGNGNSTNPIDPGFGYGSLRWPQIDRPNAAQTAMNAAVKTRAFRLPVDLFEEKSSTPKNATFDTFVNTAGSIEGYFTIEAANDRFIDVTLSDEIYNWGAAHPNTDSAAFLWWLDQKRELTPADVFLPTSGWQQRLVPLTIASLNSNADIKNMLWKGDALQKPVQAAIPNTNTWTVSRNGLGITFAQYAVGPYFLGMPQAHLTWTQLKPMLAHGFDPSTLPAPIPKSDQ